MLLNNKQMKHTQLLIIALLIAFIANAQTQLYYRVKINGTPKQINELATMGVTVDHGEHHSNELITEISELELALLKKSNVPYELQISDMATYYKNRNFIAKVEQIAASTCNTPNITNPTHFKLGSMGGYYTLAEMEQILDSMKILFPTLITVKQPISSTQSIEGRNIYFVKISDNPNVDEPEPEMFYNSLHHAREAASLSQLIYYMWYLLENYTTNPEIKALVDNAELYFVPCVNPDGYFYNQTTNPTGGGMWRKNRKDNGDGTMGVDLNRNYGHMWGFDNTGSSNTSSTDTYRGTGPFSEPETQAMRDFVTSREFKFCITNHTYSNLLIYPWGYLPSYYTPDSALFVNWAKLLTKDDQFLYGTGDQTVNYTTNGDSDDWMYGEQVTKPKLLSMTPEAGSASDGFWPLQTRIIDICKTTFSQNLNAAWLISNYALLVDKNDAFITQQNGYLKYNITRLGLLNGTFTVNIKPVTTSFLNIGAQKIYSSLANLQSQTDSINFTLNSGLTNGTLIKFAFELDNGFYTFKDTITKIYGSPITVFKDSCDNTSKWTATGWSTSSTQFVSANKSITDSPLGNYGNNQNKFATITASLNLTDALFAHLQFYTKYETEKTYDYVQLQVSTNGTSYAPLCGKFTSPGTNGTVLNQPIYDGKRNEWAKEEIDLSAYVGQNIKLRFNLKTDAGAVKDGFYFDDVLIRKIVASTTNIGNTNQVNNNVNIYPNPTNNFITIQSNEQFDAYKILNQLGQTIKTDKLIGNKISVSELEMGIYYIQLIDKNNKITSKKIMIAR